MPILGLEGERQQRQEQEQRRKHTEARRQERQMRQVRKQMDMKGTIMELSGDDGPDFAPYQADPEWDGLGKKGGGAMTREQVEAQRAPAAAKAFKPTATPTYKPRTTTRPVVKPRGTQIVGATPSALSWDQQLTAWFEKFKAMLGIK